MTRAPNKLLGDQFLLFETSQQAHIFRPRAISVEEPASSRLSMLERNEKILIMITVVKIVLTMMMMMTIISDE